MKNALVQPIFEQNVLARPKKAFANFGDFFRLPVEILLADKVSIYKEGERTENTFKVESCDSLACSKRKFSYSQFRSVTIGLNAL
jgi:hypothetical protein